MKQTNPKVLMNRKDWRALKRKVEAMQRFMRRVYKLSPELQQLLFDEWHVDDWRFQYEARRLVRKGVVNPPKGVLDYAP